MKYTIKRFSSIHTDQEKVCYIMIGLPGSGKSTYVEKNLPGYPVISRDKIREELGYARPGEKKLLPRGLEAKVTQEQDFRLNNYIQEQVPFVLDNTNLKESYLAPVIQKLKSASYKVVGVVMQTPLEVCIQRRRTDIAEDVMRSLGENFKDLRLEHLGFDKIYRI